jgi:hypothetical protein
MTRPAPSRLGVLLVVLACAACGGSGAGVRRDTLTQRQKDSAIGESGLPGARGIRGAQTAADSAASRRAQEDSVAKEP